MKEMGSGTMKLTARLRNVAAAMSANQPSGVALKGNNYPLLTGAADQLDELEYQLSTICAYLEQTANSNSDLAVARSARAVLAKATSEQHEFQCLTCGNIFFGKMPPACRACAKAAGETE